MKPTQRTRGATWTRIRDKVMREHPHCAKCLEQGRINPADELDHIIPLHKGGTDDRENLMPLCQSHHRDKTASDMGWKVRHFTGLDGWPK